MENIFFQKHTNTFSLEAVDKENTELANTNNVLNILRGTLVNPLVTGNILVF